MKRVTAILMVFLVFLYGCAKQSPMSKTENTTITKETNEFQGTELIWQTIASTLAENDIVFQYHGLKIDGSIDMELLAEKLDFNLKGWINSRKYIRMIGGLKPDDPNTYAWYMVKYPYEEKADLEIEFVYNQTTDEPLYLINVTIFTDNIKTDRGITVGDSENALTSSYGNDIVLSYMGSEHLYYRGETDEKKQIGFTIDAKSRKITKIYIDYNRNRAIDEFAYGSLAD